MANRPAWRHLGVLARLRRRRAAARRRAGRRDRMPGSKRKIAAWALMIGLACGFFDLPRPLEDTLRAARSAVRLHPADQSVVVVTVDDRSLNELGVRDPRRDDDARFLDTLFALGAQRVFFDRAYADASVLEQDLQFVRALQRHRGRVYVGALADFAQPDGSKVAITPNPVFRPHAEIVSIKGWQGPFGLSTHFPASSVVEGTTMPSLSAELARVKDAPPNYRVDFSIDLKTIPTLSYIDVLRGQAAPGAISGRDVVVAPSSRINNDYHPVPFREKTLGAFLHVLAAETLKNGRPIDLGWYPAFALVALVIGLQLRRQLPSRKALAATVGVLLIGPIALDAQNVNVDVAPGLIALAIAWTRLSRFAKQTYRGSTGLQRLEAMQDLDTAPEMDVVALKIRNFATISANLAPEDIEELLVKAQAMLRAADPVAEVAFEKDTLVWLRPKVSANELENHARGLHALFRTSITIGAHAPDVASAIGIDASHDLALRERIENAIQCAEDAAHDNRIFMVSEPALAEERTWRLQILSELENAISNDEVEVVFQPKVALASESIVGAEALLRWHHPVRGPIDPSMVIACAEEHNRVDMITRFVLERAMREARRAIAIDPSFKVAVNISALDLRDPTFADHLERLIAACRFPVGNLVLEITETAPIENDAVVAATFVAIKNMGVRLSVDDFGIGHASLHYLRQIPADEVKIDRSFVVGMETSAEDRALVRTAVDMIHSLGRSAVAEGVENQATVELLREIGCDTAQGYYYFRPISMDELAPRLRQGAIAA